MENNREKTIEFEIRNKLDSAGGTVKESLGVNFSEVVIKILPELREEFPTSEYRKIWLRFLDGLKEKYGKVLHKP